MPPSSRGGGGGPVPTAAGGREPFPAVRGGGPGWSHGSGTARRGNRGARPPQRRLVPRRRARSTPAALRVDAPGALNRGGGRRRRRIVPIAGCGCEEGRANQRRAGRTKGGAGGEGAACARGAVWRRAGSRVSPRGRTGPGRSGPSAASAPSRAPPPPTGRAGPAAAPPPAPSRSFPGPVCGRRRARSERTPTRSMPRVFCWNIRRTFMAILSVRADFCQAQHSILADK
ncbi:protein tyrosine phosphatase type IVA 2 isoform X1 [Aquila chrysaetos chrysaetos]|uniref:protein tyrosine phosphatase type IVA 2 isoform X1 n=1 Tax=Aquila chrysaetos chrysaetos TaxID=223781 RepID=UPI0011770427|nr:protein tyrosine phosphatase type IVA 2 isoform X1 [Aquila chrysaetos chrysaetos]